MSKVKLSQREPGSGEYDVLQQEKKGGPWGHKGVVASFGAEGDRTWAALGKDAEAWTDYKDTRAEATREMLGGHTFKTRQLERDRAEREQKQSEIDFELEA